jgi:hypothetical protein
MLIEKENNYQTEKEKEKENKYSLRKKFYKYKNSLRIRYEYTEPFQKKFKSLKKQIKSKNQNPDRGYNCIFKNCEKIFPNYTRWMLHYRVHVRKNFLLKFFC